jgi:hypothetical protein
MVACFAFLNWQAHAGTFCTRATAPLAVDLSRPATPHFLKGMKALNVGAVIRYYDHKDETIVGKTLHRKERDLILSSGFSIAVVFQHNNNRFASFTTARGEQDGMRALALARENLQPKGSAIYFGVDGPWGASVQQLAAIKAYFIRAHQIVAKGGYKVGVYGSGLVCEELRSVSLIDYCWLANARSWPGYGKSDDGKMWALKQTLPEDCAGINVDFDVVNSSNVNFGQFR